MTEKVKNFQIRWKEPLGRPECPYLYRWVFVAFGFSVRVHKWIRSDDKRFYHDHPWNFLTIVLKGSYTDVSEFHKEFVMDSTVSGTLREELNRGDFKFRRAEHRHYVDVPKGGCWTLLFCGRKKQNWGFWIEGKRLFRPLRYFSKYGHPPCHEQ